MVSFGHNDANRAKAERYVPAEAFGESLRPFWDAARSHGAVCIFASPVAMREFDGHLCKVLFIQAADLIRMNPDCRIYKWIFIRVADRFARAFHVTAGCIDRQRANNTNRE